MNTTHDTNQGSKKIIDATARLKPVKLKVLKAPPLTAEEAKVLDQYIAARRRAQAAGTVAEELKPRVLTIVQARQQVARRGALVSLDKSYAYHYSVVVTALAKTVAEARERERENGTAKAVVTETVAFEDVRRREREKRERMEKAG
jgi:hypothetical protein